uniref:Negative elongation factor E n=1 Tax=Strongyloides venezuelensis TaxID=75913 RepID=A0A0K0F3W2_STRVS
MPSNNMLIVPSQFSDEEKKLKEKFEFFKQFKLQTSTEKVSSKKPLSTGVSIDDNCKRGQKRSVDTSQNCTAADIARLINSGELKSQKRETFKRSKIVGNKRVIETVAFDSKRDEDKNLSDGEINSPARSPEISHEIQSTERKRSGITSNTAYIRGSNLMYNDVKEACEVYGNIIKIYIPQDKKSAFVEFDNRESTEKAVAGLNLRVISGSTVRTNFARQKQ